MEKQLKKSLLNCCKDKDAEVELRQSFVAAYAFRQALSKVISDKSEASRKAGLSGDGYDCPNWAHKQADRVGYQRAIEEILNFLG